MLNSNCTNINNALNAIGTIYKYDLGSPEQHLIQGVNTFTVENTDIPAGNYIFTVIGVHQSMVEEYLIEDISLEITGHFPRIYYGNHNPGMCLIYAGYVANNPTFKLNFTSYVECTTFSTLLIEAIRIK